MERHPCPLVQHRPRRTLSQLPLVSSCAYRGTNCEVCVPRSALRTEELAVAVDLKQCYWQPGRNRRKAQWRPMPSESNRGSASHHT